MNILQRISFPESLEAAGLYFRVQGACSLAPNPGSGISLAPGQSLSLNTYFNSWYQQYYATYTNVRDAAWRLRLTGDADIFLYRDDLGAEPQLIATRKALGCTPDEPVMIEVPDHPRGRIYLEFTPLGRLTLHGGELVTRAQAREVRLAVVMTCYKRDEFVHDTVKTLLGDPDLADSVDLVLVDNGDTLKGYEDEPRMRIVPNPNTGGAGGFSRGMREVLLAGQATHILLMDDDISLQSEAVLRTIAFFAHATRDVAVSGAMLDAEKIHLLHEAGAQWNWDHDVCARRPLKLLPLKQGIYLQSRLGLNALLLDEKPDYGAFWFFAFPCSVPREHGLCLPFFVVGDDIDFGLKTSRLAKLRIVPLPSIAVRHMPFYFKLDGLAPYFFYRNLLAVSAIHDRFPARIVARQVLLELFKPFCTYDYERLYKIMLGVEDFLRGPEYLEHFSLKDLQKRNAAFATTIPPQELDSAQETGPPFVLEPRRSCLLDLLRAALLGGHLVPSLFLSNTPGQYMTHKPGQWRKAFGHKVLLVRHKELHLTWRRRIRQVLGLRLFWRCFLLTVRLFRQWDSMCATWRTKAREMSSMSAWEKRLGLNKEKD